jgi:MFS transporter, DHA1 family, inner membrane transport protein
MTAENAEATRNPTYGPLVVLATGMFAIGTGTFVVAGILPDVAQSLAISQAAAGQLMTAWALSYALLSPVMAGVTARLPRRTVLLGGLVVFVLGHVGSAVLPTYDLVLLSRVVAGVGAAMFAPTATGVAAAMAAPERRARAIAIVVGGLTVATAFGSPLGTWVGSAYGWRTTMLFVAAIGALGGVGIVLLRTAMPLPPPVGVRERLAPLSDLRVGLTLGATLTVFTGLFAVYSYVSLTFDRATGGRGTTLAVLLIVWGVASAVGNVGSGPLTDRYGSRRVINSCVVACTLNFLLLPMTSRSLPTGVVAMIVWGACGWGIVVPQLHRLISTAPPLASLLSALNATTVYLGASVAAVIGAVGISTVGAYNLGPVGAVLIVAGLVLAELAHRAIGLRRPPDRTARPVPSETGSRPG